MSAKLLQRQKPLGKVDALIFYISLTMVKTFTPHPSLTTYVFSDADKKPADNLTKLAAMDVGDLLPKTRGISKDVLFNV